MIKSVCMFCMRSHKVKPALCQAKGDILRAYLDGGLQMFQVMAGVERGLIKLEAEALALVKYRKEAAKRKKAS